MKPRLFTDLKCLRNCKSEWITTPLAVMAPNAETSGHPKRKPPTPPPHCIPSLHLPSLSNKVTWPDPYLGSERGSPIYPHPSSLPHGCCCSREEIEDIGIIHTTKQPESRNRPVLTSQVLLERSGTFDSMFSKRLFSGLTELNLLLFL